MSTKTNFKRIALVAVSALGFGLMSVVPAAQAAQATTTLGTATASVAVTGQAVEISVPLTFTAGSANDADTVTVIASTVPVGANTQLTTTNAFASNPTGATVTIASGPEIAGSEVTSGTDRNNTLQFLLNDATSISTKPVTGTAKFFFTPSVAGAYTLAYFKDANADETIDSGETVKYLSFTAVTAPATQVSLEALVAGTYSTAASHNDAWLKLTVKDSAGVATRLSATQQITVTMPTNASLVGYAASSDSSVTAIAGGITAATFGLGAAAIGYNGVAYLKVNSTTAATYAISASIVGSSAAAGTVSITYATPTAAGVAPSVSYTQIDATSSTDYPVVGPAGNFKVSSTTAGIIATGLAPTVRVAAGAASAKVAVRLGGSASLFGGALSDSTYVNLVVTVSDTANASTTNGFPTTGAFTNTLAIPSIHTVNADGTYKAVTVNTASNSGGTAWNTALTITGTASTATTTTLSAPSSSTIQSVAGATITATLKCVNQYGAIRANTVLTPAFATGSRNAAVPLLTVLTNASGLATVSWTDASTSTTNVQDVLNVTGCGTANSILTVNYNTAADYGVSTITWSAGGGYADADSYEGANVTRISAGNDPSTNARRTLDFTVKDSAGVALVGVPVTFTIAGNSKALIVKSSTTDFATVYTNSSGVAQTNIFAWGPGKATVTATAGGKTATGYHTFKISNTASDARVLSGTFADGVLSFKVVDRFGNGVEGITINLSRTGTGYFGTNGQSTATPATGPDGTVDILFNGTASVKAELGSGSTQAFDVAGKIGAATPTAAVAGTTTGTGDTLAPAGVWNITVATTAGTDPSTTAANAATDAALEAIDAANAAVDAANQATEAADAATVAAEEARDAADAATAAVEALAADVAKMINEIKAQLSAMAKTIATIAKRVK